MMRPRLKAMLSTIRTYLEETFTIPTYSDRLADTGDSPSAVVYLHDVQPWTGDAKTRSYRLVVGIRFQLEDISNTFTEADAQEQAYLIWQHLVEETMIVPGLRLIGEEVRCGTNTNQGYVVEMTFQATGTS